MNTVQIGDILQFTNDADGKFKGCLLIVNKLTKKGFEGYIPEVEGNLFFACPNLATASITKVGEAAIIFHLHDGLKLFPSKLKKPT